MLYVVWQQLSYFCTPAWMPVVGYVFAVELSIGPARWCCGLKTTESEPGLNSNFATFIVVALGKPLLNHAETQLPHLEKEDDYNPYL